MKENKYSIWENPAKNLSVSSFSFILLHAV